MVNQQKVVQQETAYSAVVVNDHMYISGGSRFEKREFPHERGEA